ncbi:MAG: cysteine dioxygenase family protein [Cyanobacteria bacterium J06597_16]
MDEVSGMVSTAYHKGQLQYCADDLTTVYPAKITAFIKKMQAEKYLTPQHITELVREAAISSEDLMPWADFDHSAYDSYGRKLLFYGGHFEVMVMSWRPGDFSAIHDHGATQWGAVQSFGAAKHYIYQLSHCQLHSPVAAHYSPGMVHPVDHDLIHQMGNDSQQPFLSLHVYGCCKTMPSITGNARVFDLLEGSIQYTDGGVFFCLPEDKINKRLYGIKGDMATTLMQHRLMGKRLRHALKEVRSFTMTQKLKRLKTRLEIMKERL